MSSSRAANAEEWPPCPTAVWVPRVTWLPLLGRWWQGGHPVPCPGSRTFPTLRFPQPASLRFPQLPSTLPTAGVWSAGARDPLPPGWEEGRREKLPPQPGWELLPEQGRGWQRRCAEPALTLDTPGVALHFAMVLLQNGNPRAFQLLKLGIRSNWGKRGYTCIYRVQVHGKIVGTNAVRQTHTEALPQ